MEKSTVSGQLLEAIRCFLKGEKVLWDQGMDAARWEELFRLARLHQILPMIMKQSISVRLSRPVRPRRPGL